MYIYIHHIGTFGSNQGLSSHICNGLCPKGYWCGIGTIEASSNICKAGI